MTTKGNGRGNGKGKKFKKKKRIGREKTKNFSIKEDTPEVEEFGVSAPIRSNLLCKLGEMIFPMGPFPHSNYMVVGTESL